VRVGGIVVTAVSLGVVAGSAARGSKSYAAT